MWCLLGTRGVDGLDEGPGLPHRIFQRLLPKLQTRGKLRLGLLPECRGLQGVHQLDLRGSPLPSSSRPPMTM